MKHLTRIPSRISSTAGRAGVAIAAAVAAGLIVATAAFATSTSNAVLTSDTARASAPAPACTAADLGVWFAVTQGNGAAGTIYYPLEFTNLSGHACTLYGFPGVSVLGRSGGQLGSPANWDHTIARHLVTLDAGATAHAVLAWHDVAVYTESGCDPVSSASELRVYPPNQYSATDAAFNLESCAHAGPIYLTVGPVQPGVGTIYNS
jgi:hypothetical protein